MRTLTCLLTIALAGGIGLGDYTDELWDSPAAQHNLWAYWDLDYTGPGGEALNDHNKPMAYHADGGVGGLGSGCVSVPLGDLEPALMHDGAAYWPAYPGDDHVNGFPEIDLTVPNAAVQVSVRGISAGPSVGLGGGQVRFFIGYWDGHGTEETDDDEQAFYCTKGTYAVGSGGWVETTVALGDNNDWLTIVKDETTRNTLPEDLYNAPQQWGFVIWETQLSSTLSGELRFDEFHIVPEPTALLLLAGGGLALARRRRH